MPSIFYKEPTTMSGVDMHPLDVPAVDEPHAVADVFGASAYMTGRTKSVIADGQPIIQEGCSMVFVPHVAVPATVQGAAQLAITVTNSSSTAILAVHSVLGEGVPLACAIEGCAGLNLNCSSPVDMLSGATLSLGTVMTQPTPGDFAIAAQTMALGWGTSWAKKKALKPMKPYIDKLSGVPQLMAKQLQRWVTKPIQKAISRNLDPTPLIAPYVNRVFP